MNPDCMYCGFENGSHVNHQCVDAKVQCIIDRIIGDYHSEWQRAEEAESEITKLKSELEAVKEEHELWQATLRLIAVPELQDKYTPQQLAKHALRMEPLQP